MKLFHTADFDNVRSCADNIRAHRVEAVREVNNVRFFRGIFDNGKTFRLNCRHNAIYRRTDGVFVKENLVSDKPVCGEVNHTAVDFTPRAECREALEVLVNGTVTKIAAAGH